MKWILIFSAVTLIFSGCGTSSTIKYPDPAEPAHNGSFNYEKGMYQLGEKEYTADYGTITVQENRHNSSSRLINLPVIRIHALSENLKEPVFGLSGGPGMSNMVFHPIDSLLKEHDFVIVGYRGVDGSAILDCPEVSEAFKNGEDDLLSEQSLQIIGEAWERSFNRLQSLGIDLNGYTIPETVEDLETVRKAFNYNRINLMSESYGTRIAYIYGLMHPGIINRSVMIACNPPGGFIYDPERTDEQIIFYSGLWAKDSSLVKKSPDLAATMRKVLRNMPGKWFLLTINPGKVKIVTFAMLFHRTTAAMVFDSYIAAENGDYSGLALMSLAFDFIFPDMGIWGDMAAKAVTADFDSAKIFSIIEYEDQILGSPMNKIMWEPMKYFHIPFEMIPDSLRIPSETYVETLILSGNLDFSTPAENGTEFLPYLKKGRQVIIMPGMQPKVRNGSKNLLLI